MGIAKAVRAFESALIERGVAEGGVAKLGENFRFCDTALEAFRDALKGHGFELDRFPDKFTWNAKGKKLTLEAERKGEFSFFVDSSKLPPFGNMEALSGKATILSIKPDQIRMFNSDGLFASRKTIGAATEAVFLPKDHGGWTIATENNAPLFGTRIGFSGSGALELGSPSKITVLPVKDGLSQRITFPEPTSVRDGSNIYSHVTGINRLIQGGFAQTEFQY
jgi:hypothetical protein